MSSTSSDPTIKLGSERGSTSTSSTPPPPPPSPSNPAARIRARSSSSSLHLTPFSTASRPSSPGGRSQRGGKEVGKEGKENAHPSTSTKQLPRPTPLLLPPPPPLPSTGSTPIQEDVKAPSGTTALLHQPQPSPPPPTPSSRPVLQANNNAQDLLLADAEAPPLSPSAAVPPMIYAAGLSDDSDPEEAEVEDEDEVEDEGGNVERRAELVLGVRALRSTSQNQPQRMAVKISLPDQGLDLTVSSAAAASKADAERWIVEQNDATRAHKEEVDKLQARNESLSTQLERVQRSEAYLEKSDACKQRQLDKVFHEWYTETDVARSELAARDVEIGSLRQQLDGAQARFEGDLEQRNKAVATLKAKRGELQVELVEVLSQVGERDARLVELEKKLEESESREEMGRGELRESATDIRHAREDAQLKGDKLVEVSAENEELRLDLERLKEQLRNATTTTTRTVPQDPKAVQEAIDELESSPKSPNVDREEPGPSSSNIAYHLIPLPDSPSSTRGSPSPAKAAEYDAPFAQHESPSPSRLAKPLSQPSPASPTSSTLSDGPGAADTSGSSFVPESTVGETSDDEDFKGKKMPKGEGTGRGKGRAVEGGGRSGMAGEKEVEGLMVEQEAGGIVGGGEEGEEEAEKEGGDLVVVVPAQRTFQSFLLPDVRSSPLNFLCGEANDINKVYTSKPIDLKTHVPPTLFDDLLADPLTEAIHLVELLTPTANSTNSHKDHRETLLTLLKLPHRVLTGQLDVDGIERVQADLLKSKPNKDNIMFGDLLEIRRINWFKFWDVRGYVLWLLCSEIRLELESLATEEGEARRGFGELAQDPEVRRRFGAGLEVLGRFEELMVAAKTKAGKA